MIAPASISSRQFAQRSAYGVGTDAGEQALGFRMCLLPQRKGLTQQRTTGSGDQQAPAALVLPVDRDLDPLGPTFFATSFGMVRDRFGVHWMVLKAK